MRRWAVPILRIGAIGILLSIHANGDGATDLALLSHRLGDSLASVSADEAFECSASAGEGSPVRCVARRPAALRIAIAKLDSLALHFSAERLIAAEARFQETAFVDVSNALHDAFGLSRDTAEKLRGGMGGYFENAIQIWEHEDGVLRLEQFVGSINTSSIILAPRDRIEQWITPKQIDPASGLKDL